MGKIVQLDDNLSNKIAAGEVVERPASVVKELVENAIDANSTRIEVLVEEAGIKSIRIIDNGDGIEADDVLIAFSRHATSKIKDEKDLFRIRSLGFRGEALPSIASISKVSLKTSTGEDMGTHVVIEGGEVKVHEGCPSRKGTDITIEHIFYNTPARLKYLRSESTELGNISDVMNRLALSYPNISFKLMSNDRVLLNTAGNGNITQVFASVYGMEAARKMVSIEGSTPDFEIEGVIGMPELVRANRNYITLLVNGRYVKSFLISRAILEGYHTLLPINRYPYALINVKLDPILVDVNVHPSKMEVRLSKEKELMELVTKLIKEKLQQQTLIPTGVTTKKQEKQIFEQQTLNFAQDSKSAPVRRFGVESKSHVEAALQEIETVAALQHLDNVLPSSSSIERTDPLADSSKVEMPSDIERFEPALTTTEDVESYETVQTESTVPVLYVIGQLHGTYILAQNETGLFLVDQHAAQERLKFEFYKEKLGEVSSELQELLIPITLAYSTDQCIKIRESMQLLEQNGLYLEEFGMNSYIVRALPVWFPKGEEQTTIDEIVEQVLTMKKVDVAKLREELAISMSCKGSIKANRHLRTDEMQQLLDDLRLANNPYTCPHGRPIFLSFTTKEIEKMFKRIQV